MAKLTAREFQEKHQRRLIQAIPDVRTGIDKVTENPCEKAAAAKDKMLARLTESVNNGKWEAGLKRVDLATWKRQAKEVGAARIDAGIRAASAKVEAFAAELLPFIDSAHADLDRMPDLTLEDSIARMTFWTRRMNEFKRTR